MILGYTPAQVRGAEAPLLDDGRGPALMATAARALAGACLAALARPYGSRAVLLLGPGNNGGDALFAGAHLARRGVGVTAVLALGDRVHEDGLAALRRAGGRLAALAEAPALLARADLVVDGILGTGARPGLPPEVADLLAAWEGDHPAHQRVVAVDTPSGIDAATGELPGASVRAHATVTFGGAKTGLLVPPAAERAGEVVVADIGLPLEATAAETELLSDADAAAWWPTPRQDDQKYSRGVLGIAAGSAQYPGAAVIATTAAVSAGVGMVRTVMDSSVAERVSQACPEAVAGEGRVQAWVVGPGGTASEVSGDLLDRVSEDDLAADGAGERVLAVVDAGAIDWIGHVSSTRAGGFLPFVLTPHAGELARLLLRLNDGPESAQADARAHVEGAPLRSVREAAALTGTIVVLKGSRTLVATPQGHVVATPPASPWLATAGSGDALAGVIGAALATGGITRDTSAREVARLVAAASHMHARAATVVPGPVRAQVLAASVGIAIGRALSGAGEEESR